MMSGLISTVNASALVICVFTGMFLVLQSAGQLMAKPFNIHRVVAAVLFLWASLFIINIGIGRKLALEYFPHAYGSHIPPLFLAGPLLEAYIRGVIAEPSDSEGSEEPRLRLEFPGYLTLTPFLVATLVFLPSVFFSAETRQAMFDQRPDQPGLAMYGYVLHALTILALLSAGFAYVRLFWKLGLVEFLRQGSGSPAIWHFRNYMLLLAVLSLLAVVAQILENHVFKRCLVAVIALGILWLYLLDHRYPGFFHRIDREIRRRRLPSYRKSKIQNLDTEALQRLLETTMHEERLYADEDISLEALARAIRIQPAQLSELLNNVVGTDFRRYVNGFRIEAAKHLLTEEPDRSTLSIGIAVGFNSKSAFNRNFKDIVGDTPAAYRALHINEHGKE